MREHIANLHETRLRQVINRALSDQSISKQARYKIGKLIKDAYSESGCNPKEFVIDQHTRLTEFQISTLSKDWVDLAPNIITVAYNGMHTRTPLSDTLLELDYVLDELGFPHLKEVYRSSRGKSVIIAILLCAGLKYVPARCLSTGKNVRRLRAIKGCEFLPMSDHIELANKNLTKIMKQKHSALESLI